MSGHNQVCFPFLGGSDDLLGRVTDSDVHRRLHTRGARAELAELGAAPFEGVG